MEKLPKLTAAHFSEFDTEYHALVLTIIPAIRFENTEGYINHTFNYEKIDPKDFDSYEVIEMYTSGDYVVPTVKKILKPAPVSLSEDQINRMKVVMAKVDNLSKLSQEERDLKLGLYGGSSKINNHENMLIYSDCIELFAPLLHIKDKVVARAERIKILDLVKSVLKLSPDQFKVLSTHYDKYKPLPSKIGVKIVYGDEAKPITSPFYRTLLKVNDYKMLSKINYNYISGEHADKCLRFLHNSTRNYQASELDILEQDEIIGALIKVFDILKREDALVPKLPIFGYTEDGLESTVGVSIHTLSYISDKPCFLYALESSIFGCMVRSYVPEKLDLKYFKASESYF